MTRPLPSRRSGFTMLELAVVVTLIGVLSLVAVPRYRLALERAKATTAFSTLAQIQAAQERHAIHTGGYARRLADLDVEGRLPVGFRLEALQSPDWENGWRLVLRRAGASNGYGAYAIVWTENGYSVGLSTLPESLLPTGYTRILLEQAQGETGRLR